MSPAGPGTGRSDISTPDGTAPNSHLVTALSGIRRACRAMTSASLIVATEAMRLVSQPQARSRRFTLAMA